MRKTRLIDAIMPRGRQAVLAAMLLQPQRWWYAAELARHLRVRQSSLQRELSSLTRVGILRTRRAGRMLYYQPDPQCPILDELRGLMLKTAGLVDVLRDALAPLADRIECAFVYGSIARNDERSDSDIDVMVIGDVGLNNLTAVLGGARETLGREINPRRYRPAEFAKRLTAKDHFLTRVLARPKLFVIGSSHVLEQLAESPSRVARAEQQIGAGQPALDRAALPERRQRRRSLGRATFHHRL
jgi:predicted nucleotidyltransferase